MSKPIPSIGSRSTIRGGWIAIWFLLCAAAPPSATPTETSKRPVVANFELKDLKGKRVRLKALRGKVVVVSFWATWCVPCKAELKVLSKLYTKYRAQGLEVLAISTDGPETLSEVRTFPRRYRWKMPVLMDVEGVAIAALNPRGTCPYTVFVDREGRSAFAHEGFTAGDAASFEKHIVGLLAEGQPAPPATPTP